MLALLTALTLATGPVVDRQALASQLSDSPVDVRYDAHGRLSLVRGSMGQLGNALRFVTDRAAPLGLRGDEQLRMIADHQELDGSHHVRFGRTLSGVKVEFDQVRVHAGADGIVNSMEAETSDLSGYVHAPPHLTPAMAIAAASGHYQGRWASPPQTDLVILGSRFEGLTEPHLAWKVYVAFPAAPGKLPVIDHVYVDAHDGHELGRVSAVYTAGGVPKVMTDTNVLNQSVSINVTQYADGVALQDTVTLSTTPIFVVDGSNNDAVYTTTSLTTSFGDKQAVSVSDLVHKAVAFDKATFGWDKWDFTSSPSVAGGMLLGVTHVGTNMANAYFTTRSLNGKTIGTMNYGDGDGQILLDTGGCLDVSGHEIGHGIVTGTADLAYHNQSGALNEHFADVFGWMLDSANDTIGEGCTGPALSYKPLRDMCHPALGADPQPEVMADFVTSADTTEGDHGGVHTNSGIPNHAACLFRNAVAANADRATAFSDLGKIWYRALSQHLGPTASFTDMVTATATSCTELSLGTTVCAALNDAWAQVGLAASSSGGTCPPNSTAQGTTCTCNAGYHVNSAKTGCDPDATVSCPPNSHVVAGSCYCDTGYVLDATGTSCVLANSDAACGAHAHRDGTGCVCDECYQYQSSKTGEGQVCMATPNCVVCTDPLKDGSSGTCVCEAGTTPSGSTCVGVAGNCGAENYAGRCVGSELIYCNTNVTTIETIDCSKNAVNSACGLSTDGYDCVAPTTNCGSVPASGACNSGGASASYCDQGTLKTVDCGINGCGTYTYQGVQLTFCYLCPPHATYNETSKQCACDSGYVVTGTAPNQTCTASGTIGTGGGISSGGTGGGTGGGGTTTHTGCTTTNEDLGYLALLGLLLMRRRR